MAESALAEPAGEGGATQLQGPQRAALGTDRILDSARRIAFLPIVQGGLGLRSSALLSPAAYWAAWADVLPIIVDRVPALGEHALQELESGASQVRCVAQAAAAETTVTRPEFPQKPTWRELAAGIRPPEPIDAFDDEPGQWPHGWQFYASLGLITYHREHAVLPSLDGAAQARVRSQSGAHAGDHVKALPTCEHTTASAQRFNGMLRRRVRLPVATGRRHCPAQRCQDSGRSLIDCFGDHPAACPRTLWGGAWRISRNSQAL